MRPIHVVHVLGRLNPGGVETWLLDVARGKPPWLRFDFLVHTEEPGLFDDEVRALGCGIIPCPVGDRLTYAPRLAARLRALRPDVVHSHVHHFSAVVLAVARAVGVPVRIAHSHNDTAALQGAAPVARRAYFRASREVLARVATHAWACSTAAGVALFHDRWGGPDTAWIPYGVDFSRFEPRARGLRAQLGFAPGDRVIGNVASFSAQKNHGLLLDVFAEVARNEPRARLVLVGDGALRAEIEARVAALGLGDRVTLLGLRKDVPALMSEVFDAFLLPSRYEGLGIVILEAQAAGLPSVISDVVPPEADVVPEMIARVPLDAPVARWADAVGRALAGPAAVDRAACLARMNASPYETSAARARVIEAYGAAVNARR